MIPGAAMVAEVCIDAGHTNLLYIGDRIKKPGTLNGKSANLNHVIFRKIYPHARRPEHIPERDILMVMDCDHMIKPDIYNRMAPCMIADMNIAVVLVPQSFFNLIMPDSFDTAGKDFTFIKMPFAFGASIIYITGVMRDRSSSLCSAEALRDSQSHSRPMRS